ncbi:unnamed protein product [Phytophthora fragariaefolia]|uniref:Unnamed protein product n=1 Tax=Phytophthora fragariaefolia TaxID=1490495 RepID=A0A9W6WWM7_9STRA|nr:unnamed protein product [Phytophthora fragariaefolia]
MAPAPSMYTSGTCAGAREGARKQADDEDDDEDCAVCVELGINTTVSSPVLLLRQQIADAYDDDAFYAGRTDVLVFVDRFSKMVNLAPVAADGLLTSQLSGSSTWRSDTTVYRSPSCRIAILATHPRSGQFVLLGTRLLMSTAAHPETDEQTERVNCVLEDVLRSYATYFPSWSSFKFALNNATHALTGLTPFFVNNAQHPRVLVLPVVQSSNSSATSTLGGGGRETTPKSVQPSSDPPQSDESSPQAPAAEVYVVENHALLGVAYEELAAVDAAMPAASTVTNFVLKPTSTPIDSTAMSKLLVHHQVVKLLCVTPSRSLLISRRRAQIGEAGRTRCPYVEATEYSYPRMESKAAR